MPADYDGDGKTDIAVYRRSTGRWLIINSATSSVRDQLWGASFIGDPATLGYNGDVPVPADYTGDGKADLAIYRDDPTDPTGGQWYIQGVNGGAGVAWGSPALDDLPVVANYYGDVEADEAVYRPSTGQWFIWDASTQTVYVHTFGSPAAGDTPLRGDFDGDGYADIGVYRTTTGTWYVWKSSTATLYQVTWGSPALWDAVLF